MPDPFDESFTQQTPIVAAAIKIRARQEMHQVLEEGDESAPAFEDAESAFRAFGQQLQTGSKRLNSILCDRNGVKLVTLEKPPRIRLRFQEKRIALDLDEVHQLVRVAGFDLDGEWQFDPSAPVPSLINLSK